MPVHSRSARDDQILLLVQDDLYVGTVQLVPTARRDVHDDGNESSENIQHDPPSPHVLAEGVGLGLESVLSELDLVLLVILKLDLDGGVPRKIPVDAREMR